MDTIEHKKIIVTGASGRAGRAVLADLLERGAHAVGVDLAPPVVPVPPYPARQLQGELAESLVADLTDLGQTLEVMKGADAVVHMANIPAPGKVPPGRLFADNMVMNYNVFSAARDMGLQRVVWASSETTLGLPFATPPSYLPVDEDHYPLPGSSYALSKVASETIAEQFARWTGVAHVALRFSNILGPADYEAFPSGPWQDVRARAWNLWGYVDERDVAQICRLALTAEVSGAPAYVVAAADTVMNRPSRELAAELYPGVEVAEKLDTYGTLLAIDRAREELGYAPEHSWRQTLGDHTVGGGD
jgi:nucleoside-diphosphate-sugar epimerase